MRKVIIFFIGIFLILGIRYLYRENIINGTIAFLLTVLFMAIGEVVYCKYIKQK